MKNDFEKAMIEVEALVKDFKENESFYLSTNYQEDEVRRDFINKFFIALGWDVNHDFQKNPYEQEVKTEKTVKVQRARKKADYAFYLKPNFRDAVFYVEAKKPSRDLYNKDDYFQTIMYGFNSQTPIAVLTDFEEFHIVDTRYKTDIDTALSRRIKQYHYFDYLDEKKFAEIYFLFSRQSVEQNSIFNYAENLTVPKGKSQQKKLFPGGFKSVDESILDYLDETRLLIAKSIKRNHVNLNSYDLTDASQTIINRLIFIRFLEDKLIETDYYISEFGETNTAWNDFLGLCRRFDAKYNGVVFKEHFIDKPNFLPTEDEIFRNVCNDICHLNSDFYFDIIPIHILGSIYERFLGKIVRATPKRVFIEEKPEVKKAGGVFYTPQYIVRHIVTNTVGKQIEGKTPAQISKMKFADIACGSGSFLITVFENLLDYHSKWYNDNPDKAKKDGCIYIDAKYVLSLKIKQAILTNNLFGVDLDSQAVDVTKLSLYLKLLEDETTATANDMMVLFKEKILPPIEKNIRCGNSLIDNDIILFNKDLGFSDEEIVREIKPFSWKSSFPETIKSGGFDAIVGNPPYDVLEKDRNNDFKPHFALRNYLKYTSEFTPAMQGKLNLFRFFIIKSYNLTKEKGRVGLIVPLSLIADKTSSEARQFLMNNNKELVADCFPQKDDKNRRVFREAKQSTVIIIGQKSKNPKHKSISVNTYPYNKFEDEFKSCKISLEEMKSIDPNSLPIPLVDKSEFKLLQRFIKDPKISTFKSQNERIRINRGEINQTTYKKYITDSITEYEMIKGTEVGQYRKNRKLSQGHKQWFLEKQFLNANKKRTVIAKARIATQRITGVDEKLRVVATIINPNIYFADSTNSISISDDCPYSLQYILALLNSKLFQWRFQVTSTNNNVATNQLDALPFRIIDFKDKDELVLYEMINTYVKKVLELNEDIQENPSSSTNTSKKSLIRDLHDKIDDIVFDLYKVGQDEIG